MTQNRQIGDPFEQAVTTGKIGRKQNANNSDVQTPGSLNTQASESPNIQTSENPNIQTAESLSSQKSKHRGREQQTIYLPPHLVRKLKVYKALHDKEYSNIVAEALEEYFQTHQD